MNIELTSQQIGLISCSDYGRDRQHTRLGHFWQHYFIFVFAVFFGFELCTTDLKLDLRIAHRPVVCKAVKVERYLLAAKHANEFKIFGDSGEAWQCLAFRRRSSGSMVMAFAGPSRYSNDEGRAKQCSQRVWEVH